MKKFKLVVVISLFLFCNKTNAFDYLNFIDGEWSCESRFNLNSELAFVGKSKIAVMIEEHQIQEEGTYTTYLSADPSIKSILSTSRLTSFNVYDDRIIQKPISTDSKVISDKANILSPEFLDALANSKTETKQQIKVINQNSMIVISENGNDTKCTRM